MRNELVEPRRMSMPKDIDLSTEEKCRDLLARYPDNSVLKDRLAEILRSQRREEEATGLGGDTNPRDFKYHWASSATAKGSGATPRVPSSFLICGSGTAGN